jgi:hypothetical protein
MAAILRAAVGNGSDSDRRPAAPDPVRVHDDPPFNREVRRRSDASDVSLSARNNVRR